MAVRADYEIVFPEQSLPASRMVGLGLQHVIAMFGATVLAPFLMGFDPNLAIFFSGIGTLIFMVVVRGRIPSYLGSSFAFIGPVIAAKSHGGVPAALGGIAAAAVVYFIVGFLVKTRAGTRAIAALMPPPVTAAVVAVIGIGLAPVGWDMSSKGWPLALFTLAVAVFVAVATRGFPKLIPVLIAVIAGYVVAAVAGSVDFSAVAKAAWIGLPSFVAPAFGFEAISLIVPVVVMLVAENLGHVKAVAAMTGRNLDAYIGRAFLGDGIATMVAGSGGGTGVTTYAENIGVMAVTKIYSSLVFVIAALVAIAMGLCPKFGQLIYTVPGPVIGGLAIVLFGLIATTGARIWVQNKVDFGETRNLVTVAAALTIGAGDLTLTSGDFSLSGIAIATFGAILVYQILGLVKVREMESTQAA